MKFLKGLGENNGKSLLSGVPTSYRALVLSEAAKKIHKDGKTLLHIALDDVNMASIVEGLTFFAPNMEVIQIPAWDTVPYDRVSPKADIIGKRIESLTTLATQKTPEKPRIVIATVSSILQRVPTTDFFEKASFLLKEGQSINLDDFYSFLEKNGYNRSSQVMEQGDYAVRGGIVDVYPSGAEEPLRLDFFGDELDSLRTFDPITQRSTGKIKEFTFRLMSEITLDKDSVSRFRSKYRELFGAVSKEDALYESISNSMRFAGMENWLPLFHDGLDTIFAYVENSVLSMDYQCELAKDARYNQILDYFNARLEVLEAEKGVKKLAIDSGLTYKPVHPEKLYISPEEWNRYLSILPVLELYPFEAPEESEADIKKAGAKVVADFADVRTRPNLNLYEEVKNRVVANIKDGKKTLICSSSNGARERLDNLLFEHGLQEVKSVDNYKQFKKLSKNQVGHAILTLEKGFETDDFVLLSEQDIIGDKLNRSSKSKKKSKSFIEDISALSEGDIVVHTEHGIGRYEGLVNIKVGNAPHDCLCVLYADKAKLFVPVENIDVLSKYGEGEGVVLDRLGGTAWQARKSKLKKRIRDMAEGLIKIAAERELKKSEILNPPEGTYDEFAARFPFVETEDQKKAIDDVIGDLGTGKPMDRLVCGDVGFGKTEVALRAAFVAAMSGVQVAVVVPTTLLARQHYLNFVNRLKGFPIKISMLSRMITPTKAKLVREEVANGSAEIVVGTHAILSKNMRFCNLGLLIIDEEQHFGVAHKERLKQLKSNVHVLTLTATPIPRTLQLSLTGVRDLSLIATPPVDRLAVRTFVLPFDEVVIKEAILRERYRGGQIFYVCPRVSDIAEVAAKIKELVPEIRIAIGHGQMSPKQLEDVMNAFAGGEYDLLLSTTIIESGIDMPTVNTMIVHRSDMFGLSQLYQLRGRIGRGKVRAYAYLTVPPRKKITKTAEKRLGVMQALDSLGAGFSLASHDLDIRGAGNLLGEEQSGHIKEVGVALYQHMLEEAVAAAKSGAGYEEETADDFSPQISTGSSVLIPENYIKDLNVRLSIYRKIGAITDSDEIELIETELIDRFGSLPDEVKNLLEIIEIKSFCKKANVEKVDAGHKGAVFSLRDNRYPNPAKLVEYISQQLGLVKVRPDHKIVVQGSWITAKERIKAVKSVVKKLAQMVDEK